ncbi:MAG: GNAT family N-acetyltransferase [Chloroflexota bacterium]|nr:GNAT family N-acetyltransferase [Chloroflexota bacterium]
MIPTPPAEGVASDFVLLRDGGQVELRPFEPNDRTGVEQLLEGLSEDSRILRFHSFVHVSPSLVDAAVSGHAILAIDGRAIVALASYYRRHDPKRAEIALTVADAHQGRGIGTALFERLAADARAEGIGGFLALVLGGNRGMIDLLNGLGFHMARQGQHGTLEFDVHLQPDAQSVAQADARRHVAAGASLEPLFRPRSVAVVGASRQPGAVGNLIFENLLAGNFAGPVYPVNPAARFVASVRAYATATAIQDQVDLAVIAVPAERVIQAAEDSLAAGARALVVVSAGFAETGPEGRRQQEELLRLCRSHGARLVGPNCLGVLANAPSVRMNATFAPVLPAPGNLAIASQSGALGIAILNQARELGIGISDFVSMGNKADLSSNDLLERWEDDPDTEVILLYLESFGNPRRFARVARRVGARKPIVAIKGGRGESGRRATASHTAALAGSNVAVDALFCQAGVIHCDTLQESFDLVTLLANQPLPAGRRVGIITNAGGLGILCADACEANGLEVPVPGDATLAELRTLLPAHASFANPLDVVASCPPETYGQAMRLLLADPTIDAVIALFIPLAASAEQDLATTLGAACDPPPNKPLLACFAGRRGTIPAAHGTLIPLYSYPEEAARALGLAAQRGTWLRKPAGHLPAPDGVDRPRARATAEAAVEREGTVWLTMEETGRLLSAYGISTPPSVAVHSAAEAAKACRSLGTNVAVKLSSTRVLHKSDVDGVRLGVSSPDGASQAYRSIEAALRSHGLAEAMEGALVQAMVTGGVECLVGVVSDPIFGPLIAFGLGGVTTEVLGDVAFRLHPLTDVDAAELVRSIKGFRLLDGYRGRPKADVAALQSLLLRVSQLVEDVPEIVELDLNPVLALEEGAVAVDARIRLHRALSGTP